METKDALRGWLQLKAGDAWELEGLASTPDLDEGGDVVLAGAFAETLRRNPTPVLLWSHRQDEPIGKAAELKETAQGLWGRWVLSKTQKAGEIRQLVKDEVAGGLSIGYTAAARDVEHKDGVRYIKRLALHEVSVCCLPMNTRATIARVKAGPPVAGGLVEAWLREHPRFPATGRAGSLVQAHLARQAERTELLADRAHLQGLRARLRRRGIAV
jgi:HK97 family phage prohead protease